MHINAYKGACENLFRKILYYDMKRRIKMRYESAIAYKIFLNSENLLWISRCRSMSTYTHLRMSYAVFSTWTSVNVLKTDVSFRPTARLNERESLKSECKRRIVVSLYLSTAATYVRSSRVISGNFAHRFQCMYIQKDLSQLTTFFSGFFFFIEVIFPYNR